MSELELWTWEHTLKLIVDTSRFRTNWDAVFGHGISFPTWIVHSNGTVSPTSTTDRDILSRHQKKLADVELVGNRYRVTHIKGQTRIHDWIQDKRGNVTRDGIPYNEYGERRSEPR